MRLKTLQLNWVSSVGIVHAKKEETRAMTSDSLVYVKPNIRAAGVSTTRTAKNLRNE